jgi:hypothetical protein
VVVNRIVRFDGPDGARLYELAYESLAVFRGGKERRTVAASTLEKLARVGTPKPAEQTGNPDLELLTLNGKGCTVTLEVRERDLLVEAVQAPDWPTFALAKQQRVVALLENAEPEPSA